jgi:hypothetical protein
MGEANKPAALPSRRRLLLGAASIAAGATAWLPSLHLLYVRPPAALAQRAEELARYQLDMFRSQAMREGEAERMRLTNPEWDFMGRTFLAYALAEMAVRDPAARARHLAAIDDIVADTLRREREGGLYYFLMPYARRAPFRVQPARSLFLDGEIALMLALRRLVEEREDYKPLLAERVAAMVPRMGRSPVLSAESYPDECWTFCNTVALAAIKAADVLDGTDHAAFIRAWIDSARERLVDRQTGLLVSSYTLEGQTKDGPEGSSIWMAAHMLHAVDAALGEDQYRRARSALGRTVLGFGYAREWPPSHQGQVDVDSGPIVPGLDASGGSSGLAFLGAASYRDADYLSALHATLDLAAFPVERDGRLHYAASNQVGDAVILYSMTIGPLWEALAQGRRP